MSSIMSFTSKWNCILPSVVMLPNRAVVPIGLHLHLRNIPWNRSYFMLILLQRSTRIHAQNKFTNSHHAKDERGINQSATNTNAPKITSETHKVHAL